MEGEQGRQQYHYALFFSPGSCSGNLASPSVYLKGMLNKSLVRFRGNGKLDDQMSAETYTYAYPRPMVTVDAVVFREKARHHEVLLILRGQEPFAGHWALPGGFIDMDEDLDAAVARELAEETGLCGLALRQLGAFGEPKRDPRGRTISVVFWGLAPAEAAPCAGDDAAAVRWFDVTALPPLAFDHDTIIAQALQRLNEER